MLAVSWDLSYQLEHQLVASSYGLSVWTTLGFLTAWWPDSKGECPEESEVKRRRFPNLALEVASIISLFSIGQGCYQRPPRFKTRGCRPHYLMGGVSNHSSGRAWEMWQPSLGKQRSSEGGGGGDSALSDRPWRNRRLCKGSRCYRNGRVRGVGVTGSSRTGGSELARVCHDGSGPDGGSAQETGSTVFPGSLSCAPWRPQGDQADSNMGTQASGSPGLLNCPCLICPPLPLPSFSLPVGPQAPHSHQQPPLFPERATPTSTAWKPSNYRTFLQIKAAN